MDLEVTRYSAELLQGPDDFEAGDQLITIELLDAGAGPFFVIKTDRWAFDGIEDLVTILNKFKKS